jgi:hypothetical protein
MDWWPDNDHSDELEKEKWRKCLPYKYRQEGGPEASGRCINKRSQAAVLIQAVGDDGGLVVTARCINKSK